MPFHRKYVKGPISQTCIILDTSLSFYYRTFLFEIWSYVSCSEVHACICIFRANLLYSAYFKLTLRQTYHFNKNPTGLGRFVVRNLTVWNILELFLLCAWLGSNTRMHCHEHTTASILCNQNILNVCLLSHEESLHSENLSKTSGLTYTFSKDYLSLCIIDHLAKPASRSRYAHTPFGSAPVPILSS